MGSGGFRDGHETIPWYNGTEKEHGAVDEQIDDIRQSRFYQLASKPPIVVEAGASAGRDQVVRAQGTIHACDGDGMEEIESKKGCPNDEVLRVYQSQHALEAEPDNETHQNVKHIVRAE